MLKKYTVILTLLLTSLIYQAYGTNGMFPIFSGVKAGGRGGTDIGIASDPSCINTNPAGIGFLHGKVAEFTAGSFIPRITFKNNINDATSDFEPIPFGSFAAVFDRLEQFTSATDPVFYLSGGNVNQTEYIFYSGEEPFAGIANSRNKGQGRLKLKTTKMPNILKLHVKGKGATISNIKVYAHTKNRNKNTFFSCYKLPNFPIQSKVAVIVTNFQWYKTKEMSKVILKAEDKEEILELKGKVKQWNKGYLALVWEKKQLPSNIQFFSKDNVQLRSLKTKVGYRLLKKYYWKNLKDYNRQNGEYSQLFVGYKSYQIDSQKTIKIPINKAKQSEQPDSISIYYQYKLNKRIPDRFLQVGLQDLNPDKINNHLLAYTETNKESIPVYKRSADYELPSYERTSGFKFGFGIFPQAGAKYTINTKTDLYPEGFDNRTDYQFLSIVPSIAYRFNERFSIGVSLNFNFELIEFDALVSQDSRILKGDIVPGFDLTYGEWLTDIKELDRVRGELDTNYLYGFGIGAKIGFLWKITDRLQLGVMYSPPTWMTDAKGEATLNFANFVREKVPETDLLVPNGGKYGYAGKYDVELDFNLPQSAGVGLSYLLLDNLLIGVDFKWIDYSDTEYELKTKLKNGSNKDLNEIAGSEDVNASLVTGWDDQYVISTGIVWQANSRWIFRMGYNYGNNPVKKKYLNPELAGITEHHITIGSSYLISRNVTLNFLCTCALPNKLKSDSENLVHEQFANSEIEVFNISSIVGVTWRF